MKRTAIIVFALLGVSECFSQAKIPRYILGVENQHCSALFGSIETHVFQFFADSTFSLTDYETSSILFSHQYRQVHFGRYRQQGDSLFLNDSLSKFYPIVKDEKYFSALTKNARLRLFPATIILDKNMRFVSYLNVPIKLKTFDYSCIARLEQVPDND